MPPSRLQQPCRTKRPAFHRGNKSRTAFVGNADAEPHGFSGLSEQRKPPTVKAPVTRAYLAEVDFEAMLEEDVQHMDVSRQRAEQARQRIAERRAE